jgi:hypothetical protein
MKHYLKLSVCFLCWKSDLDIAVLVGLECGGHQTTRPVPATAMQMELRLPSHEPNGLSQYYSRCLVSLRFKQAVVFVADLITSPRRYFRPARVSSRILHKTFRAFRKSLHHEPAFWTAVASAARHRFGTNVAMNPATSRLAKAPSPLRFAGAVQKYQCRID